MAASFVSVSTACVRVDCSRRYFERRVLAWDVSPTGHGYGAREIAQAHQKKSGGTIYVNAVSAKIACKDFQQTSKTRVQYAVAEGPIFSLIRRDGVVVRAYWPRLED